MNIKSYPPNSEKMENKKQIPYLEFQAYFGGTKHYGGLKATKELIELCYIDKNKCVLDVGCGVGLSACYIAKKYGCKVIGVDISESMIASSKERAKRRGVENRLEFKVADVQKLPFKDAIFDAVISESVLAFVKDKRKAISEYVRVIKPKGYVGMNETIWTRTPHRELAKYIGIFGAKEILTHDGYVKLLQSIELYDMTARSYKLKVLSGIINEIRQFSLGEYLRAWYKFLSLCISSQDFRRFIKKTLSSRKAMFSFMKYSGYGIYVGRK